MKKIILLGIIGVLALAGVGRAQGLRKAVWAGQFYEAERSRLTAAIDGYLAAAKPAVPPEGRLAAIIVPHAGYVYSAATAAYAYKLLQGADIDIAVILGPSHRVGFKGCSIYEEGGFETPLGVAEVDAETARAIAKASGFGYLARAHAEEHSVEVQVPFLQRVLPKARIVPIVMGIPEEETIRSLAGALTKVLKGKKAVVVASTDMSHYLSKAEANALDKSTIALVESGKMNALISRVVRGENIMCGGEGVAAALLYARSLGEATVDILKYDDSSSAGGPPEQVVGYFSAAVTVAEEFSLSAGEKKELLALARRSVESFVREGKDPESRSPDPNLGAPRGVFVTLTEKGELRGCIGFIEPIYPLDQAVARCAVYAASEDPRFAPVRPDELGRLSYEISVLTPIRRITDPKLVQVGRHGLVIAQGGRRGLLLPQVATENHWDREEFLSQTCLKAGLNPDAWKRGAEISTFEAIVFH
jgi:AmmeMemoRadiSam system protein B/AmmeMemoRadiSam system protein A